MVSFQAIEASRFTSQDILSLIDIFHSFAFHCRMVGCFAENAFIPAAFLILISSIEALLWGVAFIILLSLIEVLLRAAIFVILISTIKILLRAVFLAFKIRLLATIFVILVSAIEILVSAIEILMLASISWMIIGWGLPAYLLGW